MRLELGTRKRWQGEDELSDVAKSHGMLTGTRSWKRQGTDSSLEPLGVQLC